MAWTILHVTLCHHPPAPQIRWPEVARPVVRRNDNVATFEGLPIRFCRGQVCLRSTRAGTKHVTDIRMPDVIGQCIQSDADPGGPGFSPGGRRGAGCGQWSCAWRAYERRIGSRPAHFLSTAALLILLGAYMRVLSREWPIASRGQALQIGFVWAGLTIAFEFGLGHFVAHEPWSVRAARAVQHRTRQGLGADSRLGRDWSGGAPGATAEVTAVQADRAFFSGRGARVEHIQTLSLEPPDSNGPGRRCATRSNVFSPRQSVCTSV